MKRLSTRQRSGRGFTLLEASLWVLAITGAAAGSHFLASTADHANALEVAEFDARKMRLVSHLAADYWYLKPELDDSPDLTASLRWPTDLNALTATGSTVILGNQISNSYNLEWLRLGGRIEIQSHNNIPSDQYPYSTPTNTGAQSYLDVIASYPGNSHAQCRHAQYVANALHAMGALQQENHLADPAINWGSLVTVNCASTDATVTLRTPDPNMIVHEGFNRFPNAAPRFGWVASGNLDMNSFPIQGRGNQNINTGGAIDAAPTLNVNTLNGQINAALDADVVTTIYVNNLELYQLNLAYNNFAENAQISRFSDVNMCSGTLLNNIVVSNNAKNSFCNSSNYNINGDFRVTAASDNTYRPMTFGLTSIRSCPDNVEANGVNTVATGGVDQFRNIGEICNGTADNISDSDIPTGVDQEGFQGTWNIRAENGSIVEVANQYTAPKIYLDTFETNTATFSQTLSIHVNAWFGHQTWRRFTNNNNVINWIPWLGGLISGDQSLAPWNWTANEFKGVGDSRSGHRDLYFNGTYQRFNVMFANPHFYNGNELINARGCEYTKQIVDAGSDFNINTAVALERIQAANIYDYEYVVADGASRLGWLAAQAEKAMPEHASSINHAAGDLGFVEEEAGRELVWKALHEIQDRADVLEQQIAERLDELERLKHQLAVQERNP